MEIRNKMRPIIDPCSRTEKFLKKLKDVIYLLYLFQWLELYIAYNLKFSKDSALQQLISLEVSVLNQKVITQTIKIIMYW